MKLKQSSVYRRYLKYYSVMFILPVALLCLVIGLMINRIYVQELFLNHQETISRIGHTLDNSLGSIDVMSAHLGNSSFVSPTWLKRSPLNVMDAQKRLKELQGANPLLSDIVYWIKGDFVLSGNSGSSGEQWNRALLDSKDQLSLRYQLPRRSVNPTAELIFILNKWAIMEYVSDELDLKTELFEIWDSGKLIYSAGNAGDDNYEFGFSSGTRTNWLYRYQTPKEHILMSQRTVYLYMFSGLLLICSLGFLMVLRFSRLTYDPVEKIDSYVRTLYPSVSQQGRDEFEWMYHALSNLHDRGSELSERAGLMEDAYRTMKLMSLVRGEMQSESELERLVADINMVSGGGQLFVALIREVDGSPLHGLPESLTREGVDARIIPLPEAGCVALLMTESVAGEAQRMLESICRTFKLRIGVGNGYTQLIDASRSYMEAEAAFPYATEQRPVAHYSELERKSASYRYPGKEVNRLAGALQDRDEQLIRDSTDALCAQLRRQLLPISIVRCICYDVISNVIKLSIDLTNQQSFPTATELSGIPSIERLIDLMVRCVDDFVQTIQRDKHKNDYIYQQILDYVELHVFERDFSIGNMAHQLGFSQSHLSHVYKAKAGDNLITLVSDRRIARAQELLRGTELPLREIIEQIGYNDTSNFIRKFKQQTGKTPGEYKLEVSQNEQA